MFYITQYIQNTITSTCNQCKKKKFVGKIFDYFFVLSFLNLVVIFLPSTSQFGLATFQVLSTHRHQVVALFVQV